MKSIQNIIILIVFLSGFNLSAQDYFVVDSDTTYCTNLEYATTAQGFLKKLEYNNQIGQEVSLQGRSNIPDIQTFYIDSLSYDKVPHNPGKKNDKYPRFDERVVNGKIVVYFTDNTSNNERSETTGSYRFILKMPDGTYYNLGFKKNINKYIKPYLLKCNEFKQSYKGDYSNKVYDFIKTIELYNSLCE